MSSFTRDDNFRCSDPFWMWLDALESRKRVDEVLKKSHRFFFFVEKIYFEKKCSKKNMIFSPRKIKIFNLKIFNFRFVEKIKILDFFEHFFQNKISPRRKNIFR